MKKLSALVVLPVLVFLLVGCGSLEYHYNEDNMSSKTEDGGVKWKCDIRYPFFKGGCSDEINAALDPVLRGFRDEAVAAQGEADEVFAISGVGYEYDLDVEVIECDGGYVSLRFTDYRYYAGAHGGKYIYGLIFDEKTGDVIAANELMGLTVSEFSKLVCAETRKMIDASPEMFYDDVADEFLLKTVDDAVSCSYLDGGCLVYVFQEYAIAPYVGGPQYVKIPLELND